MVNKIKVWELDFGDMNVISRDRKTITDWIDSEMEDLQVGDELNYCITTKLMTQRAYEKLPDWS